MTNVYIGCKCQDSTSNSPHWIRRDQYRHLCQDEYPPLTIVLCLCWCIRNRLQLIRLFSLCILSDKECSALCRVLHTKKVQPALYLYSGAFQHHRGSQIKITGLVVIVIDRPIWTWSSPIFIPVLPPANTSANTKIFPKHIHIMVGELQLICVRGSQRTCNWSSVMGEILVIILSCPCISDAIDSNVNNISCLRLINVLKIVM